jgi:hypothetical protein
MSEVLKAPGYRFLVLRIILSYGNFFAVFVPSCLSDFGKESLSHRKNISRLKATNLESIVLLFLKFKIFE